MTPNYKAVAIPFWLAMATAAIMWVIPIHLPHIRLVQTTEHTYACSANYAVCSNQFPSTPGPNGVIRVNINDGDLPHNHPPAYNRVAILLHWEPSAFAYQQRATFGIPFGSSYCVNGWCPVVKAAIGGMLNHCATNCYLEYPNNDPYDPTFTRWEWWTAEIRKDGLIYNAMTGWPGL